MQIKKNPREEGYPDATAYGDDSPVSRQPSYDTSAETVSRSRPTREQPSPETAEAEAPRTAAARAESVVDAESSFDGRYEAAQDLRILGSISGEVVCRGTLTIERDATAKARIQSRDAQVRGRLEGDIVCTGRLLLTATAVVTGTIKAATLVVEEGASVSGNVQTTPGAVLSDLAPTPLMAVPSEKEADADAGSPRSGSSSSRWNSRTREVPSFALVSSEERAADRS